MQIRLSIKFAKLLDKTLPLRVAKKRAEMGPIKISKYHGPQIKNFAQLITQ